jgi:hypothetical protein
MHRMIFLAALIAGPCLADATFERDVRQANKAHQAAVQQCKGSRYPGYCQDIAGIRWNKAQARAEAEQAQRKMRAVIREQDARLRSIESLPKQ